MDCLIGLSCPLASGSVTSGKCQLEIRSREWGQGIYFLYFFPDALMSGDDIPPLKSTVFAGQPYPRASATLQLRKGPTSLSF